LRRIPLLPDMTPQRRSGHHNCASASVAAYGGPGAGRAGHKVLAVAVTTAAPAGAIADGAALATTPAPTVDVAGIGNGISASPGPSTRPFAA
jgi:hypothetical protein